MIAHKLIAVGLLGLAATAAGAETTYSWKSQAFGTTTGKFTALSGQLVAVQIHTVYDRVESDTETPVSGSTGECFGSAVILSGLADGGGNCIFTDPAGNRVIQRFAVDHIEEGKVMGTWSYIGGTGPHEGVSGRGYYEIEMNGLTGTVVQTIKGVGTWR